MEKSIVSTTKKTICYGFFFVSGQMYFHAFESNDKETLEFLFKEDLLGYWKSSCRFHEIHGQVKFWAHRGLIFAESDTHVFELFMAENQSKGLKKLLNPQTLLSCIVFRNGTSSKSNSRTFSILSAISL